MIPAAGHGLGLAIVRQIVEKLGGQVGGREQRQRRKPLFLYIARGMTLN
jgi:signal transduction histidine kinase